MARMDILERIAEIRREIANHKSEWFGMLGTCWERDDWKRKHHELRDFEYMLAGV